MANTSYGINFSGHYEYLRKHYKKCSCNFKEYTNTDQIICKYNETSTGEFVNQTNWCQICKGWVHHNRYWALKKKFQR
ncbi:hypothetical protein M1770_06265 [Spiroplasma citri]|uniref:Uncharacterized protein n=1 Tax=Spiroplasma citri TaxID=2133 RepID=Q14MA7_SPICI|nr:hypothetical protein [Spiroplasma citri]WFG97660.1 hypothetical protein M1770_06265 [Spiroplasma citri]CAK99373.1 hypothetical protein SPICI11_015 [Spiroplasma citri]